MKDEFQSEEKQVKGMNDLGFIPLDPAPISNTKGWQDKSVASDNVRIENGNFLLADQDAIVRFFAGRNDNGIWEVVMSQQGIDARIANNSQVLFSSNVIFFEHVFTSPSVNQSSEDVSPDTIQYSQDSPLTSSAKNATPMIRFFKRTDQTITSASLYAIFNDAFSVSLGGDMRVQDIHARLNPTKTLVNNPGVFSIWTYLTGGTDLSGAINPSSDGYTYSKDLTTSDLTGFIDGWNVLLLQSDTNALPPNEVWSYASITLVVRGYVNL